ncbi:oxygen-regulated protein 1-like [Salvelinus alpinus]|uniref:oxygen-regulated protein 1-like n=1 Tax=Salvelinus alpinus TaxID=8036 RepID=UPI0039FCAB72
MSEVGPRRPHQDQSSGSGHTVTTSRHPYITDPIASKHVCFYKSGDPQFSGLRMAINSRTFKTFDALLDSLSKKVPLPFGVRNITTPRGVHAVHTLDELEDGKAYICSDQRKVKPINMAAASKKLPPWYHARPMSARHRALQLAKQNHGRPMRKRTPVTVRTPKRLMVFRNGDPSVKHNMMLQKRTTPTFEALLDYVSELMHFPVVKLHTPDGRRVDGLPALILCSGIVVAAGREAFKSGNYKTQRSSAPTWLPARRMSSKRLKQPAPLLRRKKKSVSSSKSRLFSSSSERYFMNQIHHSIAGSQCDLPSNNTGSVVLEAGHFLESVAETDADTYNGHEGADNCMPGDDDIEKSFRVNQDGSMTVEMKVRLTIKEEETLHWTTTLTRSSVASQLSVAESELEIRSPESNALPPTQPNAMGTINGYNAKKDDHDDEDDMSPEASRLTSVEGDDEDNSKIHVGEVSLRRAPTPGPRRSRQKQASLENINTPPGDEIQENIVGSYSYRETTKNGEVKEEYCMVRQCSSRPVPKPRRVGSMDINNYNKTQSTFKSGAAEILQIQNGEEEVRESVMHIYEQQTCQDNFLANSQYSVQGVSMYDLMYGRPATSETARFSSSNDLEMELERLSTASESLSERRADQSLSSDFTIPTFKAGGSVLKNRVLNVHETSLSKPTKDNETPKLVSEASKENSTTKGVKKVKKSFSKHNLRKYQVRKSTTPDKRRKESNANGPENNKRVKTGGFSRNASIRKMYGPKPARSLMKNKLKGKEIKLNIENPKESSVKELNESFTNWNIPELNANSVSCAEALKMIESLREIANIENAEELKASLSDLQKSTSAQLLQSWKGFQELNDKVRSRSSALNSSEHDLLFETGPVEDYNIKEKTLDIDELINELDVPETVKEALEALSTGVSMSMDGNEIQMSQKANEKVESSPEGRVNDNSTAVPKEEAANDNVLNKEANVDVKSIIKTFTNIHHPKEVAENTISPISESPSSRQEQYFSSEEHSFKEDYICHRNRQAANKEGSEVEQDNWEEEEAKCTHKQVDHDEKETSSEIEQAYSLVLHDGYLDKPACSVEAKEKDGDIQAGYVEEEESLKKEQEYYIENPYVEQEIQCIELQVSNEEGESTAEQAQRSSNHHEEPKVKCVELKVSSEEGESLEEGQEYYIENPPSHVGQEVTSMELQVSCKESVEKDQASSEEEQKCHAEDQISHVESENKCMEEEWFKEEQQCHIEDQPSYFGLQVSREERESTPEEQASSEEERECHIGQNHEDPEVKCLDLQDSSENGQSTPKEDQSSSDEELECHVASKPTHEEPEVKCTDVKVSSEESMSSLEEEQASLEEELECHIENQPSHEEKGVKCIEMQVSREEREFTPEDDRASLDEEEENRADNLPNANAHINVKDEQTHLWMKQTTDKEIVSTVIEMKPSLVKQHSSDDRMDKDSGKDSEQHVSFEQQSDTAEEANVEVNRRSTEKKQVRYEEKLPSSEAEHVGVKDEPYTEDESYAEYEESFVEKQPFEEDTSYETTEAKTTNRLEDPLPSVAERVKLLDKKIADVEQRKSIPTETTGIKPFAHIKVPAFSDGDDLTNVGPGDCVPMEENRWLLRDCVIRKSVSEPININKNTSALTEDECKDTKEDVPYSLFGHTDWEDMVKTVKPLVAKCTYFNLPHGCDSDPYQDDLSSVSKGSAMGDVSKDSKDNAEEPKLWAEKNETLPAFSPTDFKMPDNKVHPLIEAPGGGKVVVVQPGKGQSGKGQTDVKKIPQEPDALEMLYFSCGQHCPIL